MSEYKVGKRLYSTVCDAEAMVIKVAGDVTISCGGAPMSLEAAPNKGAPTEEHMHGCLMGKRYITEDETVELLCVKPGKGSFGVNGAMLLQKETKKLPSSD